ncbi:MAG: hypothetical protein M1419_00760 [Bacteroidetes bacterium]|nr:hypothetical protein [Bacteroidota bacterium]
MKKFENLIWKLFGLITIIGITSLFFSCTGPEGPSGKDGATGTEVCKTCHNESTVMYAKMIQWENSVHATGVDFERNDSTCAPCHTSEGFRETIVTGKENCAAKIKNPSGQNCRTCHFVHANFDSTDFRLTWPNTTVLRLSGQTTLDIGKGNLCARCHQARAVNPLPVPAGDSLSITSNRWGPHHGPMANILNGMGGYVFPGKVYENSPHAQMVSNGCVSCHMADAFGAQAGGHTMKMTYDYHGNETDNLAGCINTGCHPAAKSFDIDNVQTDVEVMLVNLRNNLAGRGWLDTASSGGLYHLDILKASSSKPLRVSSDQAGAILNYLLVASDRSMGVHNAKYIKGLLQNSIEALQ